MLVSAQRFVHIHTWICKKRGDDCVNRFLLKRYELSDIRSRILRTPCRILRIPCHIPSTVLYTAVSRSSASYVFCGGPAFLACVRVRHVYVRGICMCAACARARHVHVRAHAHVACHALTRPLCLSPSLLGTCRCEEVETEVAHVLSALPAFDDVTDDDANTWSSAVSVDPQWGFPDEAFADVTL